MSRTAAHAIVTGRVQGVGYRAWAVQIARKAGVDGWVRNRRDGTVEALLSGPAEAVEAVATLFRQGPLAARVENVTLTSSEETVAEGAGFQQRETV